MKTKWMGRLLVLAAMALPLGCAEGDGEVEVDRDVNTEPLENEGLDDMDTRSTEMRLDAPINDDNGSTDIDIEADDKSTKIDIEADDVREVEP